MWLGMALLLLAVWALGFVVFKVAAVGIHMLIAAAVIAGIVHIVSSTRRKQMT